MHRRSVVDFITHCTQLSNQAVLCWISIDVEIFESSSNDPMAALEKHPKAAGWDGNPPSPASVRQADGDALNPQDQPRKIQNKNT